MSNKLATAITQFARLISCVQSPARRTLSLALAAEQLVPIVRVPTPRGDMQFACPSKRSAHDPLNFGHDEPETIWWIDTVIASDDCVWDIGANIGLYTLYLAQKIPFVLAIEPSAASFSLLVRNLELNNVTDKVSALCIALAAETGLDYLYMRDSAAGHSMHAFATTITTEGAIEAHYTQAVLGFTLDDLVALPGIRPPDHLKIDVDGTELAILKGAEQTLARIKSILIEDVAGSDSPVQIFLTDHGFIERSLSMVPLGRNASTHRNRLFENPTLALIQ